MFVIDWHPSLIGFCPVYRNVRISHAKFTVINFSKNEVLPRVAVAEIHTILPQHDTFLAILTALHQQS